MIYYSIVLLVVILYVLFKGHEKTYMIIVAVILTLFAGLRADTIGADTLTYSWIFEKVGYEGLKDTGFFFLHRDRAATMHEPGFDVIAYAITYIGDFLYLKLFCAAIVIVPACIYIYKNSCNVCYSVLVFFLLPIFPMLTMCMMRQSIAMGMFLITMLFLDKIKFWHYILFVMFAFCFHTTSIILLPVFFFDKLPIKKSYYIYYIIVFVLTHIFSSSLFMLLSSFSRMQYEMEITGGGHKMLILMIAAFLLSYKIEDKFLENRFVRLQIYLLFYTILLWIIGLNLMAVLRLAAYTEFFFCIYTTSVLSCLANKSLNVLSVFLIIVASFFAMQSSTINILENHYYPYYFFWE